MRKLSVLLWLLLVSGCARAGDATLAAMPLRPPAALNLRSSIGAPVFKTLYSFTGRDGGSPSAALIAIAGTFYGTTTFGGDLGCFRGRGCGTLFKLSPSGAETVLHRFETSETGDGVSPYAGLVDDKNTLYGTTRQGGDTGCRHNQGCGTVFSVATSGDREGVLHAFQSGHDGRQPVAALTEFDGTFYGVTSGGGTGRAGTIFNITTSGMESVVHNFQYNVDGSVSSVLADINGSLYGTTYVGGPTGNGTIFMITPSGTETVLYSFSGGADGAYPGWGAGVIDVGGTLYGTTTGGGGSGCVIGCGTAFKLTNSGVESVLHRFNGPPDGSTPYGGLLNVDGTLYGTTASGGAATGCGSYGCGTVFEITPSGTESVIHSFNGPGDGANPMAGLIYFKGRLYGTTEAGGGTECRGGCGTVFSIAL